MLGVCLLGGAARAAELPATEEKVVAAQEVDVRSGPSASPSFYATGKLHRGDKVQILKDRPAQAGWVAIKPPPGSFSWVNARLVKPVNDYTGQILAEDTPVLVGSALSNNPPSVRSPRPLARGTIVVLLDKPLRASDGSRWYPIEPNPTEVRYIPASAVESAPAVAAATAKEPADAKDPVFQEADRAERARRFADADRLYRQAAQQTNDPGVKVLCANRLASLARTAPAANPPQVALGQPQPPANQATSMYGTSGAAAGAAVPPGQWSGPGWIMQAGFQVDGRPVYRLVDWNGAHVLYLVPQPGISLDQYVHNRVNLYGPVTYRSETVRAYFMSVGYVKAVP
jgi:hypothetical protein